MSSDDSSGAPSELPQELTFPDPPEKAEFTGERYVSGLGGQIRHEHFHRYLFAAPLCSGRSVLDVACGEGYGCALLAQVAGSVVGVDIDAATVDYARRQYASDRVSFIAGDATALPLPTASVDVVTSFETIEHFADHEAFLSEVKRVLRPGGLLIVSSPNRPIYTEEAQHHNPFHVRELDREEFRSTLRAQFENVTLLEQRPISGSALVAEAADRLPVTAFESTDGLRFRHGGSLLGARYFVAVASNAPLPDLSSSLLFDSSPADAQPIVEAVADERDTLAAEIAHKDTEIAALKQRADRAERQASALRASNVLWAAQREAEAQAAAAEKPSDAPSSASGLAAAATLRRLSPRWWLRRARGLFTARRRQRARLEFDGAFYLRQNPDVEASGADPFTHYLWTGWQEGRDPNPGFSTAYYLEQNADVRASGINPFVHYVVRGRGEGRRAHPLDGAESSGFVQTPVKRVALLAAPPPTTRPARIIAFYLPQFHAIPENDEWWGKGFTEWTNVRAAKPQFEGHYQPHVPGELGYYNLLDPAIQKRQVELAKLYGIEGFCFYFYWFAGKRLLEKPVENWLKDTSLDLPFCLCWANENWTRRWDGLEKEVLIAQQHSPEDDIAFIAEAAPYLRDPRYIRVDGKPVLLVYRPSLLPSAAQTAARWRQWCRDNGIGEIHLAYTQSFENVDPREYGFDAAVEFPPNNSRPPDLRHAVKPLSADFDGRVYDWRILGERSKTYTDPGYRIYRSVNPGWDNTARRKSAGTTFVKHTPDAYRAWVENAVEDTIRRFEQPDQRLVFANAWNEWAEGAHLEPDAHYGYAWLQATRDALGAVADRAARQKRIVVVSHDGHPHGAQYLALNMARGFRELGLQTDMVVLGGGMLLERFAEVATVHRVDLDRESENAVVERLGLLRHNGAEVAIVNTTVSGRLMPLLKRAGFRIVSLVHELPGILADYKLQRHANDIAEHADHVVFAAQVVREGFEGFAGRQLPQSVIRPQGLYSRTPHRSTEARAAVRAEVRARLGLRADTRIMLGMGYGDHRKGLDLFVDAALRIIAADPRAAAVWVGHLDRRLADAQIRRIESAGFRDRILFPGRTDQPQDFYAAADVYLLSSREDPFPSVVMEALDAGVPVVGFSGVGGFSELLRRDCGMLVPAFDTEAMAAAVSELLDEPARAERFGRNGREIVEREFSFRHYLHDLLRLAGRPQPRVSVIVPNYNYAAYITQRLASIANQTIAPYELIVLDDASTDGSLDAIRQFLDTSSVPSTLVVNDKNSGSVFRQWQRGVELARGDFVWIAEADDLADPEFLAELLPAFARPDVVLSFCQSRQIDGDGNVLSEHYLDYVSDIDRERWTRPYIAEGRDEIATAMHVKNTIPNVSAVLFRREALAAVLEEHAREIQSLRHAGDWATYLRLMEAGAIAFSPRSLNSHRRHQHSVTVGNFNMRQLSEIVRVQRKAIRRHGLGITAERNAGRYAQALYEQFGLATAHHPTFEAHPAMTEAVGGTGEGTGREDRIENR
jgi:glycosyltransferase involved in cell wall biosynthesis/SAM-dependent methyltransferase